MIWQCIIRYLIWLYETKRQGYIVDYRVINIDWNTGEMEITITPVQTIEFMHFDGVVMGGPL